MEVEVDVIRSGYTRLKADYDELLGSSTTDIETLRTNLAETTAQMEHFRMKVGVVPLPAAHTYTHIHTPNSLTIVCYHHTVRRGREEGRGCHSSYCQQGGASEVRRRPRHCSDRGMGRHASA